MTDKQLDEILRVLERLYTKYEAQVLYAQSLPDNTVQQRIAFDRAATIRARFDGAEGMLLMLHPELKSQIQKIGNRAK